MSSLFGIPFDFDPIAFWLALFAIFFAMWESRKNNNIIIKIKICSGGMCKNIYENNAQLFSYFKVIIQNKGLSLHNISLGLSFTGPDYSGRANYPIPMKKNLLSNGEFAKGMIAEFELKSYNLRKDDLLLTFLKDIKKQDVFLCLYSQNYLAKSFNIGGFMDKIRNNWNTFAYKISFRKNIVGSHVMKNYMLPTLCPLDKNLLAFIEDTKNLYDKSE